MRLKTFGLITVLGLIVIAVLSFAQASPPSEAPGSIVDRITELENRIDVLEDQVADLEDQVAELQEPGEPGPMLHFGEKSKMAGWWTHQAETDGLVVAYYWAAYAEQTFRGWTDSDASNVPGSASLQCGDIIHSGEWGGFMMPVRAGDYWRVDLGDMSTTDLFYVYWIPIIHG